MTYIDIVIDEGISILAMGHADYNTDGPDIVCSAISTLCGTWIECVTAYEAEGMLSDIVADAKDGCCYILCRPHAYARERVLPAASVIITGLRLIANKYPNNIALNIRQKAELEKIS